MSSLLRSLRHHSPAMLRAIAETNGIELVGNQPRQMQTQLAAELSEAAHLRAAVAACSLAAQAALAALQQAGGRSLRSAFERRFGVIRPAGPGKLERERPHLAPVTAAEELWYRGLIYAAFAETADGLAEFLYLPDTLAEQLPPPPPVADAFPPAPLVEQTAQVMPQIVLHNLGTLLCLVQAGQVWLLPGDDLLQWQNRSLYEYAQVMLHAPAAAFSSSQPFDPASTASSAALALTLAAEMGWLRRRGRQAGLHAARVRTWLEQPQPEQQCLLLDAWTASTRWNDLCRVPALACEQTGSWSNDPAATRRNFLSLLAVLQPASWYSLDDLAAAIRIHAPDFQRPGGNYDTWYVRRRHDGEFLRGFDHWDEVEGALLRFMLTGPLAWLGAVELDQMAAPAAFRLSAAGAAWLHGHAPPAAAEPAALVVAADFSVRASLAVPLLDRFRLARFTTWQAPEPQDEAPVFRYRISQSGLQRAARHGISVAQVLDFLRQRAAVLPDNVTRALENYDLRAK
ncbi:MAG: hypothetical protein ABTQ73_04810 [Caldilineales bacterium]